MVADHTVHRPFLLINVNMERSIQSTAATAAKLPSINWCKGVSKSM